MVDMSGNTITYKGWHVILGLTAPRSVPYNDRAWYSRIGYFYSRDGKSWKYGGNAFPDGATPAQAEWAGSTQYLGDGKVQAFYAGSTHLQPDGARQETVRTTGQIHADNDHVWFTGFDDQQVIVKPDGKYYQTSDQNKMSAFRDPWVFRNPSDGKTYMLFEGNTGGEVGEHQCTSREIGDVPPGHDVPADANHYTANIGLAVAQDADLKQWKLLPPLVSANCVNDQTERPHLVIRGGKYYLFTISHHHTYAPGLDGPDGAYGFVGDGLRSDYKPLNGSGLVVGNPPDAPHQEYSHYITPQGFAESFIDEVPTGDGGSRFGGTLAPTLKLSLNGDSTKIDSELDYGFIP
jgi:levansucrase